MYIRILKDHKDGQTLSKRINSFYVNILGPRTKMCTLSIIKLTISFRHSVLWVNYLKTQATKAQVETCSIM